MKQKTFDKVAQIYKLRQRSSWEVLDHFMESLAPSSNLVFSLCRLHYFYVSVTVTKLGSVFIMKVPSLVTKIQICIPNRSLDLEGR